MNSWTNTFKVERNGERVHLCFYVKVTEKMSVRVFVGRVS